MNLFLYAKNDTKLSAFDEVVDLLKEKVDEIVTIVENRRSFREYDITVNSLSEADIIVLSDINDIGNNSVDILNRLDWFVQMDRLLVISNIPSTFMYGVEQPMNKAVLGTLMQSLIANNSKIVQMTKKSSVGRSKIEFPDNWGELYEQWECHEISSKEFLEQSGLKKATFYNMITEYRELKKINDEYIKRYQKA